MKKVDINKITYKSIKARILSETPIFWKKVRYICISIGVIGSTIKTSMELNSIHFDLLMPKYYNLAIFVGAIGTAFASLTTNDKNEIK